MLRLYNTMTRRLEEFRPVEAGKVGMYTCGPTVYNYAHIGNLRTYVFEDILKRVLKTCGYQVRHVMNVTDVGHLTSDADEGEDKMEKGAAREGKGVWEIAEFYWKAFQRDMERLNLLPPDVWCRATDHIPEQIAMIRALEEKGFTYVIEDGVYFDTSKLPDYGRLARLDVRGLRAGARIEMVQGKRSPTDFALWKLSPKDKKRQMEWPSPWGVGFPGWHVECSAMALKYLGERLDIHCGGIDHIGVHHTNEIAQTESVTGKPWVNWWMHGEFLVMAKGDSEDAAKMSKSTGGFLTLDKLVRPGGEERDVYHPLTYRYFCLGAHYRQQLAFSWAAIDGASNGFGSLRDRAIELRQVADLSAPLIGRYMEAFRSAVEDDLGMPRALAVAWGMLADRSAPGGQAYATLLEMDKVLGFDLELGLRMDGNFKGDMESLIRLRQRAMECGDEERAKRIKERLCGIGIILEDDSGGTTWRASRPRREEEMVEGLIAERDAARKARDFARADAIRKQLADLGIVLEDTPKGTVWRKA